jgi:hypothetical protein
MYGATKDMGKYIVLIHFNMKEAKEFETEGQAALID